MPGNYSSICLFYGYNKLIMPTATCGSKIIHVSERNWVHYLLPFETPTDKKHMPRLETNGEREIINLCFKP